METLLALAGCAAIVLIAVGFLVHLRLEAKDRAAEAERWAEAWREALAEGRPKVERQGR